MARKVIVYTQPTCAPCQEEKAWLNAQGVTFEDRNIRANETYFQEAIALKASSTPVTLIEEENGERTVVYGFDKEKLAAALGLT